MRFILSLFVSLLFSFSAFSVTVYNCDITATPKKSGRSNSFSWTKKAFLSQDFSNKIEFNETVLVLNLNQDEMIRGTVNGQPNFILTGTATRGTFESAHHSGVVFCDHPVNVSHLFQNKSWKQFFSLDSTLSNGHILNSVSLRDLKHNSFCFIGNIHSAEEAISERIKVKGTIKSKFEISYAWNEVVCARGHGSSPDNWVCEEYREVSRTDSIRHCYQSENDRP